MHWFQPVALFNTNAKKDKAMRYATQTMFDVSESLQRRFKLEDDIIWEAMDSAVALAREEHGNRYTGQHVFNHAAKILTLI